MRTSVSILSLLGLMLPTTAGADSSEWAWARTPHRRIANGSETRVSRRTSSLPAQEKTESHARDIRTQEASGTGFALFLGGSGTAVGVFPSRTSLDGKQNGWGMLGKMDFTIHNPRFVFEMGLGYMVTRVGGTQLTRSGNTTSTSYSQVYTRAGLVEFSPRLKAGIFEFGPMASVIFGTNANFSADQTSSSVKAPIFVGAKTALSFETKSLIYRITATGAASLTIPGRTAVYGTLGLELGIPIVKGKTVIRERETKVVRAEREIETIERETIVTKEVEIPLVLFTFDDQVVHFEFDRAQLKPASREFLVRLGQYLASQPDNWSRLKIDGHTDQVGTEDYNQRLSQARAQVVKQTLAEAGVAPERMLVDGYGMRRPLDLDGSDFARARNRRVEMSFSGVKDAYKLRDAVNRLKLAMVHPSTCQNGTCR